MFRHRKHVPSPATIPVAADPYRDLLRDWAIRLLIDQQLWKRAMDSDGFREDSVGFELGLVAATSSGERGVDDLVRELESLRSDLPVKAPRPAGTLGENLEKVGGMLGLTGAEKELLAFYLLMQMHEWFASIADSTGRCSTMDIANLLAGLFTRPVEAFEKALSTEGNLIRTGLLTVDNNFHYPASNKIDILRGLTDEMFARAQSADAVLREFFIAERPAALKSSDYPHLRGQISFLDRYLRVAIRERRLGVNILLVGPPGTGKTELTRTLAARVRRPLYAVCHESERGGPMGGQDRLRAYMVAQRALARNGKALLQFDEVEDVFPTASIFGPSRSEARQKAAINRLLEENTVPAFWVTNSTDGMDPAIIRRFDYVLKVDVPPESARLTIIRKIARSKGLDDEFLRHLAKHPELPPAVVQRACSVIETAGRIGEQEKRLIEVINQTLEAMDIPALAKRRQKAVRKLASPAGMEYAPELSNTDVPLRALVDGLSTSGAGRLCFYGPPGTGKTAFARHLAKKLKRPLLEKNASQLMSPYVGMNEKNLARLFSEATRKNAVLFVDEADSFIADRQGARANWEVTMVNELLKQMEEFKGVFVAATNFVDRLDPASRRRFDLQVRFNYLRGEQVVALLEKFLRANKIGRLDETQRSYVASIPHLAPGDFAALERRLRFLPDLNDTGAVISALEAEAYAKPETRRAGGIGFLSSVA